MTREKNVPIDETLYGHFTLGIKMQFDPFSGMEANMPSEQHANEHPKLNSDE